MDWWIWLIIVGAVLAAALVFFEWRSWNKPLSRGLEQGGSRWSDAHYPPDTHGDLNRRD
jgi:hypothetical protein